MTDRARHARTLFAGIAPEYEWMGAVLSFGQDGRWRRTMVSRVNALPGSLILDVASGTGLVARELAARKRFRVVQLDPSEAMSDLGYAPLGVRAGFQRCFPTAALAPALSFRASQLAKGQVR